MNDCRLMMGVAMAVGIMVTGSANAYVEVSQRTKAQVFCDNLLKLGLSDRHAITWHAVEYNFSLEESEKWDFPVLTEGNETLFYFSDLRSAIGTWIKPSNKPARKAELAATIMRKWNKNHQVPIFSWHFDNPYVPPRWNGVGKNGFRCPYRFRAQLSDCPDYPMAHSNVVREIVEGTGGVCGEGNDDKNGTSGVSYPNPRAWFLAQLKEAAEFLRTLKDEDGKMIPVGLRFFHECEDSWQWWGRPYCEPKDLIAAFRLCVDFFRKELGAENVFFCYSPDFYWTGLGEPGKIAPKTNGQFLSWYPGDEYVDIIGFDNYQFSRPEKYDETVTKMRLVSAFGREHRKICGIIESGMICDPYGKRHFVEPGGYCARIAKAMREPGVSFAFWALYSRRFSLPEPADGKHYKDFRDYLDLPEVLTWKNCRDLIRSDALLDIK